MSEELTAILELIGGIAREPTVATVPQDIRSIIDEYGVKREEIKDSGHVLRFPYQGLQVEVINQGQRLIGQIHKQPANQLEAKCLENASLILRGNGLSQEQIEKFITELNYRKFCFEGRPSETIHSVMSLAKMPMDEVMDLYREGYKQLGTYGSISEAPASRMLRLF